MAEIDRQEKVIETQRVAEQKCVADIDRKENERDIGSGRAKVCDGDR